MAVVCTIVHVCVQSTLEVVLVYLHELFTIQPTRSTRSSSCLTLSHPPVTSHLMFSNRAISITPRPLHHPPPPLYPTIIRSPPSPPPGHFSSHVPQPSHIHHCTTSLE